VSRSNEFKTVSDNPCKKFLEWKSNDKSFAYYDKDEKKNVLVELPMKFLTLFEFHGVKGWNDASESGIYSNEVKFIGKEELEVKAFKGGTIAKGYYKDIKNKIQDAGGHYCKVLYVMLEAGEFVSIVLKGSAVKEWGDFTQKSRAKLSDEWVYIGGAKDMKKGAVKYSVPTFEFKGSLTDDESSQADDVYETFKLYKTVKDAPVEVVDEMPPMDVIDEDDNDVPF